MIRKLCVHFFISVFVIIFAKSVGISGLNDTEYIECKKEVANAAEVCPKNSYCKDINEHVAGIESKLKCICNDELVRNPQWSISTINEIEYCKRVRASDSTQNSLRYYIRLPPKPDQLAFTILMVMLVLLVAMAILLTNQALKPLKHAKNSYLQLKRQRKNQHRLHEMEENDYPCRKTIEPLP